jgi:hypothetical protein
MLNPIVLIFLEEMPTHKPVWRLKASSRLLTDRPVTCHEEILVLASLEETRRTEIYSK